MQLDALKIAIVTSRSHPYQIYQRRLAFSVWRVTVSLRRVMTERSKSCDKPVLFQMRWTVFYDRVLPCDNGTTMKKRRTPSFPILAASSTGCNFSGFLKGALLSAWREAREVDHRKQIRISGVWYSYSQRSKTDGNAS